MDRGAWWPTVRGVAKSRTWLSHFLFTLHSWLTMIQVHSKTMQVYIYVDTHFQILFHSRFLQGAVYSSLHSTVGKWLAYIQQCVLVNSHFIPPHCSPLDNHKFVFYIWGCFYFVNKFVCIIFLDSTCKWYRDICQERLLIIIYAGPFCLENFLSSNNCQFVSLDFQ